MDLTCSQVEMLLSFYFDGDLKENLRDKVEEHLSICPVCKQKYETLVNLLTGLRESVAELSLKSANSENTTPSKENGNDNPSIDFTTNVSAYIDNELNDEENIKIKKLTINNKKARKYLEDSYALRHIINNSFEKTKNEMRQDFSKKILNSLDINGYDYTINPIIKGFAIITAIALFGTIFTAVILNVTWG